MSDILKTQIRHARKDRACDSWHWFSQSCYGEVDLEPEDWQTIKQVEAEGCKILKGMPYKYQVSVDGGVISEFHGRLDMTEICHKYQLFPED